jgi:hypothetical protein
MLSGIADAVKSALAGDSTYAAMKGALSTLSVIKGNVAGLADAVVKTKDDVINQLKESVASEISKATAVGSAAGNSTMENNPTDPNAVGSAAGNSNMGNNSGDPNALANNEADPNALANNEADPNALANNEGDPNMLGGGRNIQYTGTLPTAQTGGGSYENVYLDRPYSGQIYVTEVNKQQLYFVRLPNGQFRPLSTYTHNPKSRMETQEYIRPLTAMKKKMLSNRALTIKARPHTTRKRKVSKRVSSRRR